MFRVLAFLGLLAATGQVAASPFNIVSDPGLQFPPGCIAGDVSDDLPPLGNPDQILVDEDVTVPVPSLLGSGWTTDTMGIVVWRYGCREAPYSVIMVRFERNPDALLSPRIPDVRAYPLGSGANEYHRAHLVHRPEVTNMGAAGNVLSESMTFILQVERETPFAGTTFDTDAYNDLFGLEFTWDNFSSITDFDSDYTFLVGSYVDTIDFPQTAFPLFHGRYSGQWTIDGKPNQGLVIQVSELPDGRRFIFVIMFTYIDGEPVWVTGNTLPSTATPSVIDVEMFHVEGGDFFTNPAGTYDSGDIGFTSYGILTLEPTECGRLLASYDFTPAGLGTGILEFQRFIDLAGYNCNPEP